MRGDQPRVFAEHGAQVRRTPHIKRPFRMRRFPRDTSVAPVSRLAHGRDARATAAHRRIRVFRRKKPALRARQLRPYVVEDIPRHPREPFVARRLLGLKAVDRDLRLIVEHLLEVRHEPRLIHRIAMIPATHVIVDAATRHRPQRRRRQPHRLRAHLTRHALNRRDAKQKI